MGARIVSAGVACLLMAGGAACAAEPERRQSFSQSLADPQPRTAPSPGSSPVQKRLPRGPQPPDRHFTTRVIYVSDGDTFGGYLSKRGDIVVRIIGIDTPETKDPDLRRPECYGKQASAKLTHLLDGKAVTVAFQPDGRSFDDYGRWLLDVWTPRGKFVAAKMIRGGYARALTIWPNDQHADYLERLERKAKRRDKGMWGACSYRSKSDA